VGGIHKAVSEQEMLRRRLKGNAERHDALLVELESMLSDIAADWPLGGLADEQMVSLESNAM
jgi:hypothetical protein